eukprot:scaffold18144_cov130-Isochrysis_galbana.AAC.1
MSAAMTSTWPARAAACSGVQPIESRLTGSAPRWSNSPVTVALPFAAAKCSADCPYRASGSSTLAPASSMNHCVTDVCPSTVSQCNGVMPMTSLQSMGRPHAGHSSSPINSSCMTP